MFRAKGAHFYDIFAVVFLFLVSIAFGVYLADVYNTFQNVREDKAMELYLERDSVRIPDITILNYSAQREHYVVIDVREQEEWDQGHIALALHYRLGDIVSNGTIQEEILDLAQDRSIIFFCHDGDRSNIAGTTTEDAFDGDIFVIRHAFKELRGNDELASEVWEGSLKRVLPEDFNEYETTRIRKQEELSADVIWDVSLDPQRGGVVEDPVIHIPIALMGSGAVEESLRMIEGNSVGVICNSKISCFYAKILSYRHQKNGGEFAGYLRLNNDTKSYE